MLDNNTQEVHAENKVIPASILNMDLQSQSHNLDALAAVKAELIEETSQSTLISRSESISSSITNGSISVSHENHSIDYIATNNMEFNTAQKTLLNEDLSQNHFLQTQSISLTPSIFTTTVRAPVENQMPATMQESESILKSQFLHSVQPNNGMVTSAELPIINTSSLSQQLVLQNIENEVMMTPNIFPESTNSGNIEPSNKFPESQLQILQKNSPVAVKNMILDAAAEILCSSQPISSTQSSIHALMAFGTDSIVCVNSQANSDVVHVNQNAQIEEPQVSSVHQPISVSTSGVPKIVDSELSKLENNSIR